MKRRHSLLTVAFLVLLTACIQDQARQPEPLLTNGGFEGGWHRETIYWTPGGGPYHTEFGEIFSPDGWVTWWRGGFDCAGTPDWATGRPEVKVIWPIPDPGRIRSGVKAVQWFTFWRCHEGGLLQQVAVEPGRYYQFSVYAHSWFSNCDLRPHYHLPLDYDCDGDDPILWAHDRLSVGIDPTGGTDPMASTVEWGLEQERYGGYGDEPLMTWRVLAQRNKITVIIKSVASHPLKHDDFYIDDALLLDVTYQVFLPIVRTNQ